MEAFTFDLQRFAVFNNTNNDTIVTGTADNDSIKNSKSNALISGGAGADTIYNSLGAASTLDGGDGDDLIQNWGANVSINSGNGNDRVFDAGSLVIITTGDGDDSVRTSLGTSQLKIFTGDGNDTIQHAGYLSTIDAGVGNDRISLGSSGEYNVILYNEGDGNDYIQGFHTQSDTLQIGDGTGTYATTKSGFVYAGSGSMQLEKVSDLSKVKIKGVHNSLLIELDDDDNVYSNYRNGATILALDGDDSISNSYASNTSIDAGKGDDRIENSGMNVTIVGGAGNDTVFDETGNSTINGGAGNDRISLDSYATNNLIEYASGDGNDTVWGYNATSTLKIGDGTGAYLKATVGNDVMIKVDKGSILLKGAAALSTVNISGTEFNWTFNNGTAAYVKTNAIPTETLFTVSGLNPNLTVDDLNATITVDGNKIILSAAVLGQTNVTLTTTGNYTLALDDNCTKFTKVGNSWMLDDTAATYYDALKREDYKLTDSKTVTYTATVVGKTLFTINDLNPSLTVDDLNEAITVDGNKIILSAAALGHRDVTLTTTGNYELELADDCPTVTNIDKYWTIDGTTAIYHDAGKSDGYKLTDSKTVTYTPFVLGKTYTLKGIKKNLTNTVLNENVTIGDRQMWVTPRVVGENFSVDAGYKVVVGENFSVDAGYKVVFDEGDYGGSKFTGTTGRDTIENHGDSVTIYGGDGNDSIGNSGTKVSIDAGYGDDTISNSSDSVTINGGAGDDYIGNTTGDSVTIGGGAGDDTIENHNGSNNTIDGGAGDDYIGNARWWHVTISGGAGYDTIINGGSNVSIGGGGGNDYIGNYDYNVSINGGTGDDRIRLGSFTKNNLIQYAYGDGNDTVWGFDGDDTLIISGTNSTTKRKSGNDIVVTVGYYHGSILLKDAASLDAVNIKYGGEIPAPSDWTITNGVAKYKNLFTLTGLKAGITVDDIKANVTISGTTVTLNEKVLGNTNVTISDGFKLALASTVEQSETASANWDVKSAGDTSTATYTSGGTTAGYALDGNKIVYNSGTGGTFTLTGLSKTFSADDVSIDGNKIILSADALGKSNVTLTTTGNYSLALGDDCPTVTATEKGWTIDGTTATYHDAGKSDGYKLSTNAKTVTYTPAVVGKTFKLTGVKRNLTESDLNANVTIDGETVTLGENVLNAGEVTISDGFTLALGDDVPKSDEVSANWDINAAGDTSTAIYTADGSTEGYALDDNKIVYNSATGDTFTLTGLSKNFTSDDVTVEGKQIILSADALGKSNVTLTTTGNYSLALDEDCPTVTATEKGWTLDGTTATYHDAGKSDGYKLTNSKTVTYTPAVVGKALLTVSGVVEGVSEEDLNENLTVSGKVLTVTPDVVGKNFSVGAGYKVVFDEGNYGGSKFTGTTGRDTIEVNGNGLQIDGGKGNDTITSNGDGGNVYLIASTVGADVVVGYGDDDTVKITDSSSVTASVKASDIIVKAGKATMTLKNAATGTHLNIVDADDETLIDQTFYADRTVADGEVKLLSTFNSTSFTATDENPNVDGSAVSRKFSLTGGDEDNTLIGGKGANFIDGGGGSNELTGGKGNDTFVAGQGTDTITDYGVGTDKISLAADVTGFEVDGSDVVLNFDDDKSMRIANGAGKKINFVRNGRTTPEIFMTGGKLSSNSKSITLASGTGSFDAGTVTTLVTIDGGLTENVFITGNAQSNKIFGGDGSDTLDGGAKNDTLKGGDGNDIFIYESGKDVIADYVSGEDKISLAAAPTSESLNAKGDVVLKFSVANQLTIKGGDEILFVTDGGEVTKTYLNDRIVGDDGVTLQSNFKATEFTLEELPKVDASATSAKITITGNNNNNTIIGSKGNNLIDGGAGDDILIGKGSADTFVYSSGDDTISDYESRDKVSLTSAIENYDLSGDDVIISFGSSSLTIADAANSSITFVEKISGKVTTNVNVFAAEGIFNKAKTAVTLNADTSSYTASTSMLTIDGGLATGEIEVVGNSKPNQIHAGDNGSTISGGRGNDSLWGGSGSDTFIYSSGGGNDVIFGFGDGDALQIEGKFTASVVGENISFKVGSTANAITLKDYSATTFNVNGDTYRISGNNFVK